jgi:hypothetical protein
VGLRSACRSTSWAVSSADDCAARHVPSISNRPPTAPAAPPLSWTCPATRRTAKLAHPSNVARVSSPPRADIRHHDDARQRAQRQSANALGHRPSVTSARASPTLLISLTRPARRAQPRRWHGTGNEPHDSGRNLLPKPQTGCEAGTQSHRSGPLGALTAGLPKREGDALPLRKNEGLFFDEGEKPWLSRFRSSPIRVPSSRAPT